LNMAELVNYKNPHKALVKVLAVHEFDGKITPIKFCFENGYAVKIDKILDDCETAALKAGGQGTRYLCRIGETRQYLFHDADGWFIEVG
jgi:hypothetical protein